MTSLWFNTILLPQGWRDGVRVTFTGAAIASVEQSDPQPGDERHEIGLPGLSNVHSHGFQRGMAGLSEQRGDNDDDFWTWRKLMYRFLDRLDPDDIAAITALAYVEMLEAGYTHVGEFHYLHNDTDGQRYANPAETAASIARAAATSGIGLTLLPVFYAHGGFGGTDPDPAQRRFLSNIDSYAALLEASRSTLPKNARLGVAPHSLRATTVDELETIVSLASGAPIHIHIAEQHGEVEQCLAWSGQRPLEWLLDHAPVDVRWCLVHATHMTDSECDAMAASGAVAGLCPITEANLGDGIFPARRFLGAGGAIAIGTDSNIAIDAAGELRMLEYSQRLAHCGRNMLASAARPSVGATLFGQAHDGGAQALGIAAGIAPGRPANIATLDANAPALIERDGERLLDSWIFAARGAVDCVWSQGRQCVSGGAHIERDLVAKNYSKILKKLLS